MVGEQGFLAPMPSPKRNCATKFLHDIKGIQQQVDTLINPLTLDHQDKDALTSSPSLSSPTSRDLQPQALHLYLCTYTTIVPFWVSLDKFRDLLS
jgi:hypothetical protein